MQIYQTTTAAAMGNWAVTNNPHAVLALGDNIYKQGIKDMDDANWNYLWTNIYIIYSGLRKPWYAVTGNHDWYCYSNSNSGQCTYSPIAQVQITSSNPNGYWQLPSLYYTKKFIIPGEGGLFSSYSLSQPCLIPMLIR